MEVENPSWYKSRGYVHFDRPISVDRAVKIVTNPLKVARRAFFPFLHFELTTYRVKWNKESKTLVKNPKKRTVSYASHIDSHIYSYYSSLLSLAYENALKARGLSANVLAFRKLNESNIGFAKMVFESIKRRGECTAIGLDIEGFFDNLDHKILKSSWNSVLGGKNLPADHYAIFKSITSYAKVSRDAIYKEFGISKNNPRTQPAEICSGIEFRQKVRTLIERNDKGFGIPQGSPISATLSNLYLIEFDELMKNFVDSIGGDYFRYCDDILLITSTRHQDAALRFAERMIMESKLRIQQKKTEKREFKFQNHKDRGKILRSTKPLQYLGFLFDGEQIFLRSASLARFSDRLRRGAKLAIATMNKRNRHRKTLGLDVRPLFRKKLRERYTHFGRRNFLTYGYKAADLLESRAIRKQLKPLYKKFRQRTGQQKQLPTNSSIAKQI